MREYHRHMTRLRFQRRLARAPYSRARTLALLINALLALGILLWLWR